MNRHKLDAVLLQETRADADMQKELTKKFKKNGLEIIWGGVSPPHTGDRDRWQIPGVAILFREALEVTEFHSPIVDKWLKKGRLQGITVNGISFLNMYAHSGAEVASQRKNLYEDVFAEMMEHSHEPICVVGDFNEPLHHNALSFCVTMGSGSVWDGGRDCHDEPLPTNVRSTGSSCIDGFSANALASQLVVDHGMWCDEKLEHRPVYCLFHAAQYAPSQRVITPRCPLGDGEVCPDVSQRMWKCCCAHFFNLCDSGQLDAAWELWSSTYEDILVESANSRGVDVGIPASAHRRGYLPRSKLCPMFENCSRGLSVKQRRLYKAQCQLRTLRDARVQGSDAFNTADKVLNTIRTLSSDDVPVPDVWSLVHDREMCSRVLVALERYVDNFEAQSKRERVKSWKQRMKEDWFRDPSRVWRWLRGKNVERVQAVLEDGVLKRGSRAVFAALRRFWVPIYTLTAENQVPDDQGFSYDPAWSRCDSQIELQDVLDFVRRLRPKGASGPDGWEPESWKRMDSRSAGFLAFFLNKCIEHSRWPSVLTHVHTVFIPKGRATGTQDVTKLRPISVSSLAYRCWSWTVLRKLRPFMDAIMHPKQYGGIPGRSPHAMYLSMQLEIEMTKAASPEEAAEMGGHGFTEDSYKFFDTLQVKRAAQLLLQAGVPCDSVALWQSWYEHQVKTFRLGNVIDDVSVEPTRGLIQGCSLSLLAANLLVKQWCQCIEAVGANPSAFVDDREVEANSPELLQEAVIASRAFNDREKIYTELQADKTFCWHVRSCGVAIMWGDVPLPCNTKWALLGTDMSVQGKNSDKSNARRQSARDTLARIQLLPTHAESRQVPVAASALARFSYGQEAQWIDQRELHSMRTQVLKALWQNKSQRCPEAVMSVCLKGHLVDPEMNFHYTGLSVVARCLRCPNFLAKWQRAWRVILTSGKYMTGGPIQVFRQRLRFLNWSSPDGVTIELPSGRSFCLATQDLRVTQHVLRDALRRVLIVRAEKRRKDFEGAINCDFDVTKKILASQNSKGDIRNALYALLAGAVFTQKKRMYAGKVDSAVCPFCGEGDEDTCHILWSCPKWHSVRVANGLAELAWQHWPPVMQLCGFYVPGAPQAPPAHMWGKIQVALAQVIQSRYTYLKENNLYDVLERDAQDDAADDDEIDAAPAGTASCQRPVPSPPQYSYEFPLFRRVCPPDNFSSVFALRAVVPDFKAASKDAFHWGPDAWKALYAYWSGRQYTPADVKSCTTWPEIALDAALCFGTRALTGSDDKPDLRTLLRTVKRASKRVAAIACFELPDGPDSCRFRPLWIPAVEALDRCVRLTHYDEVNALLNDWGRFALQVEVEVPDLNRVWSRKSSWVPDVPLSVTYVRRRLVGKSSPPAPVPMALPDDNPGEGAWKDKLAARQMRRRILKLVDQNASAVARQAHVVKVEGLLERPRCAVCSEFKHKGRWMRLATAKCPQFNSKSTAAAAAEQQACAEQRIVALDAALSSAKASRPSLIKSLSLKKAAQSKRQQ